MKFSFEAWLVIGIYFFYLLDSIRRLDENQLIILRWNERWKIVCPDTRWLVLNKIPYMFNPFLPHMMAFSSNWSMRKGAKHIDEATKIEEFAANIYPLNLFAIVLWVLLLLCIPTAILSSGTGIVFFAAVCATYATILTMLAVLCLKRIELGMSSRQFFYIALDCIACPPFSINLVRKVTWQYKTNFDPIEFAVKNLDRDELVKLIQLLISRLDEQLLLEDEHTNKSDKIEAYRLKLLELTR